MASAPDRTHGSDEFPLQSLAALQPSPLAECVEIHAGRRVPAISPVSGAHAERHFLVSVGNAKRRRRTRTRLCRTGRMFGPDSLRPGRGQESDRIQAGAGVNLGVSLQIHTPAGTPAHRKRRHRKESCARPRRGRRPRTPLTPRPGTRPSFAIDTQMAIGPLHFSTREKSPPGTSAGAVRRVPGGSEACAVAPAWGAGSRAAPGFPALCGVGRTNPAGGATRSS